MAKTQMEAVNEQEDKIDDSDETPDTPRAKGKALERSESELFELSDIRKPDIDKARRDWKAKTLPAYIGLINATLDDDNEE
jgi:hypothetical protein